MDSLEQMFTGMKLCYKPLRIFLLAFIFKELTKHCTIGGDTNKKPYANTFTSTRNAEKVFKKDVDNVKVLVTVRARLMISGDVIFENVQARSPTGHHGVIALKHVVMVNEQDRDIVSHVHQ